MYRSFALVAATAAVCLSGAAIAAAEGDAAPVIQAERAFAARGSEVPVKQAFLDFAAPDGVLVDSERGAENALQQIATWPDRNNTGYIKWWPLYAGVSRDGALGFTTGAATYGGDRSFSNYFTVWKKQPDGSWKWVIDMGARAPSASPFGPDSEVAVAPPSTAPATTADAARRRVCASEEAMIREAAGDLSNAYVKRLAPEARIMGLEPQPAVGRAAYIEALAQRPNRVEFRNLGCEVAGSGDLAWSYGTAVWTTDDKPAQGTYLRVWQARRNGWVILVDNLTPDR
ncbi:MAG: nuclear transport factor 2 family protein [Caulobacteraceae bacterium]|nr:nuclear transport factor 2 family protein [Caulobacteraceae bacterium]